MSSDRTGVFGHLLGGVNELDTGVLRGHDQELYGLRLLAVKLAEDLFTIAEDEMELRPRVFLKLAFLTASADPDLALTDADGGHWYPIRDVQLNRVSTAGKFQPLS